MRVKFPKGKQREFIKEVLEKTNSPSLRELVSRGLSVNYSSLKNYFVEEYCLPENLFLELIEISEINKNNLYFEIVKNNWGQIKGGKVRFK